jgi:hypothetical protein
MVIELTVMRQLSTSLGEGGFTPGELLWGGTHECFTCEDPIREIPGVPVPQWKINGATAIPSGRYKVTIGMSPRFDRNMPIVNGVEGFTGILIHVGNTPKDTHGCLLVGEQRTSTGVGSSTLAFNKLVPKLQQALAEGDCYITYVNPVTTT